MSDETENTRRASDKRQDDIERLIAIEDDPKQRALMIVLQSINRSLIANTISTQSTQIEVEQHRKDFVVHLANFERHAMNEESIMNRGRGAWMVLSTVLTLAQGVAVYGWNASRNEIESMKATAAAAQIMHEQLLGRINYLEKTK